MQDTNKNLKTECYSERFFADAFHLVILILFKINLLGGSSLKITPHMLCAGKSGTILSGCHGDSGGPYVCQGANGNWVLQGDVSWGSSRCSAAERYTVFGRVAKFRNWIDQTMKSWNARTFKKMIPSSDNKILFSRWEICLLMLLFSHRKIFIILGPLGQDALNNLIPHIPVRQSMHLQDQSCQFQSSSKSIGPHSCLVVSRLYNYTVHAT